ncbi:hypothetical protein EDB19DRAFT_1644199 [Suillus lakei]|nr:hypothetical protein EDB19DRAFT_1644199 [Suillus lakei]
MVNKHISNDLKRAALRLKDRGHNSDDEICRITGISLSTLYRTRQHQLLTGDVANAPAIGHGCPRKLMHIDCQYLIHLARHKPTLFLDEYNQHLIDYCHLPASLSTIHCTLTHAGLNLKHVQKLASERKPLVRAGFICHISQYPAHYLVTLNEVSKENRTYAHMWGRAFHGERVEKHNPFVRKESKVS